MKSLKNILTIFVATIFLASSIGVSFINHTCTSCKTSEVNLFVNHRHSCSSSCDLKHCCTADNNEHKTPINTNLKIENNYTENNCCKDEVIFFKIKSVFTPSLFDFNFTNIFITINYFEGFINNLINKITPIFQEQSFVLEKISSPTLSKISRFIL